MGKILKIAWSSYVHFFRYFLCLNLLAFDVGFPVDFQTKVLGSNSFFLTLISS